MGAPTVVLQHITAVATAISSGTPVSKNFTSITVATGDRIAVSGRTSDGSCKATSIQKVSGTAVISAMTLAQSTGTTSTNCGNAMMVCTVTTGGTLVLSVTFTVTAGTTHWPAATLMVATGAVATLTAISTSARQLAYTPTSTNSWIATFTCDWTAAATLGCSFIPYYSLQYMLGRGDGVEQTAAPATNFAEFAANWVDISATFATTYGLANPSAGTYNTILVEFTGTTDSPPTPQLNQVLAMYEMFPGRNVV